MQQCRAEPLHSQQLLDDGSNQLPAISFGYPYVSCIVIYIVANILVTLEEVDFAIAPIDDCIDANAEAHPPKTAPARSFFADQLDTTKKSLIFLTRCLLGVKVHTGLRKSSSQAHNQKKKLTPNFLSPPRSASGADFVF